MEQTNSRWLYIFILMSLISVILFPSPVKADSNWLKYFRNDSLLNTYKRSYAVIDDSLWVGTHGDGIAVKTAEGTKNLTCRSTRSTSKVNDGLISDNVSCIAYDEISGRVWIGTPNGISSCSQDGKEWIAYTVKDGIPNDVIRDIAVDSTGKVWAGTPSGLAQFDGEVWKTVADNTSIDDLSIHSIKIVKDAVWVGTVSGTVKRYKDGQWQIFSVID